MPSSFKFFPEEKMAIIRLTGLMGRGEVTRILTMVYESAEYDQVQYSIVDFRNCIYDSDISDLGKIVQLVRQYSPKNKGVKTALLVDSPLLTAIASLFKSDLEMPEKVISINSTLERVIEDFGIPLGKDELEGLISTS